MQHYEEYAVGLDPFSINCLKVSTDHDKGKHVQPNWDFKTTFLNNGFTTKNSPFEVSFSCLCTSKFRHETYTEPSAGLIIPVKKLLVSFWVKWYIVSFCNLSVLVSDWRLQSTTRPLYLPYLLKNTFLQQTLRNSDLSHPLLLLKACLDSKML